MKVELEAVNLLLRESEAKYRTLFENMLEGFAYCRMLFENGKPRDFVYLKVNRAFEQLTGLKNVVGKKVTEVIHGIRESNPELFETYGSVSGPGNQRHLKHTWMPWESGFQSPLIVRKKGTSLPCSTISPNASAPRTRSARSTPTWSAE